jgi:hypothetical protein
MRRFTLFLFVALATTSVNAASYQKIDGTFVDPIQATQDEALVYSDYSGPNLEPDANLKNVVLTHAFLWHADLTNANLSGADLSGADLFSAFLLEANLSGADLSDANLSRAGVGSTNLSYANLTGADLTHAILGDATLDHANLSGATFDGAEYWASAKWTDAFYYTDNVPAWASGMDPVALGILAVAPILEPATLLLALLGLTAVPLRVARG